MFLSAYYGAVANEDTRPVFAKRFHPRTNGLCTGPPSPPVVCRAPYYCTITMRLRINHTTRSVVEVRHGSASRP
jgi:hypothetical protein